jgi:type IV pilus assembly protein PilF
MNGLRRLLAAFGLTAVLLTTLPSALAQTSAPQAPDAFSPSSPTPKDARTRAQVHTELGSLYFQNGNLIVALEELTIATSIDPNYAPAFSTRGLVLYYIKEFESADKDFRRALSLDEKDPEISNNYGWFLCQIGREKESIEQFQRAIKNPLNQTPEVAFLNAGSCYLKLGDLAAADDYVRRSLRFSPENPQALFQLASISYKRGNYDAAAQHLKNVIRLSSNPSAEALWLSLRVSRRMNDAQAENSFAAQLRRKYPDSPEYQELLKGNFE